MSFPAPGVQARPGLRQAQRGTARPSATTGSSAGSPSRSPARCWTRPALPRTAPASGPQPAPPNGPAGTGTARPAPAGPSPARHEAAGEGARGARRRRPHLHRPAPRVARAPDQVPPGTVIHLIARDPAAPLDLAAWCHLTGHAYLGPVPAVAPTYALRTSAACRPTQPHSPWRLTDDTDEHVVRPGAGETDPRRWPGGCAATVRAVVPPPDPASGMLDP